MRFFGRPRHVWYRWFAWRPVRLDYSNQWVWWEYVQRHRNPFMGWSTNHYCELPEEKA